MAIAAVSVLGTLRLIGVFPQLTLQRMGLSVLKSDRFPVLLKPRWPPCLGTFFLGVRLARSERNFPARRV